MGRFDLLEDLNNNADVGITVHENFLGIGYLSQIAFRQALVKRMRYNS